jgi:hypothetical protein
LWPQKFVFALRYARTHVKQLPGGASGSKQGKTMANGKMSRKSKAA